MARITTHTKADETGLAIICPECRSTVTVYHLDWSAIVCLNCKGEIARGRWAILACSCPTPKAHDHEVDTIRINRGLKKSKWITVDDLEREHNTGEPSRKGKLCPLAEYQGSQE
jgi:ribosomal protein S27E